jgi:acetyl esterase/lipase
MTSSAPIGRVASVQLRGPSGPVRARVCWPASTTDRPALLVFFPAGGVEDADGRCTALCSRGGAVVLCVFAVTRQEAIAAVEWAADHAAELDADPARLLVAGDGTGDDLAAAVAAHARVERWPELTRLTSVDPDR